MIKLGLVPEGKITECGEDSPTLTYNKIGRHASCPVSYTHLDVYKRQALSIAVCHGGTISAILESIYPKVKDNFYKWIPDPGHGYILFMEDGKVADTEKF